MAERRTNSSTLDAPTSPQRRAPSPRATRARHAGRFAPWPGRSRGAWLCWIALAAAGAAGLRHYRIDNDLSRWFPDLGATGPVQSYAVVGFETTSVDGRALAERLRSLPAAAFSLDATTVKAGGWRAGITADDFAVGPAGSYEGVFVFRKAATTDAELVGQIESSLASEGDNLSSAVNLAGPAVFHVALDEASQRRLPAIMALIVAVGGGLLWWITGRAAFAGAAMGAIILSQVVLVGALSWLRLPMDVSLSMVPPMMMSFGFSYAVHRALRRDVSRILALCAATTALGIGSFVLADVAPLRTFAVAGALGVALVWLAVVTLVPTPAPESEARARAPRRLRRPLHAVLHLVRQHARLVAALGLAATVAAPAVAPLLRFETNPLHYFPPTDQVVRDFKTLNERLTGMLSSLIVVRGDADPAALLEGTPGVRKVIDVSAMVNDGDRHFWCLADNDAMPALRAQHAALEDWAGANGVHVRWHGVAAQLAELTDSVTRAAAIALPVMGVVAALVAGYLTRSVVMALISTWVNLLPVAVLVLAMTAMHWNISLPSLMIGAIAVGMALDDTVHLVVIRRRTASTVRAVSECWRACAGSTVVAATCLACFALSPFGPTRQFGILLAVAAAAALVADLVLMPALWQLARQTTRKSRHIPRVFPRKGWGTSSLLTSSSRRSGEPGLTKQ